jgi:hypothetical protein
MEKVLQFRSLTEISSKRQIKDLRKQNSPLRRVEGLQDAIFEDHTF